MKPINEIIDLSAKTAVVTGGAKGIGRGIAERLAEAGAQVLLADTDEEAVHGAAGELKEKGWRVEAVRTDVSSEEDVAGLVSHCLEIFGGLDILVNNAGIFPSQPLSQMSQADFERVIHVNLRSVFLTTKHAAEAMKDRGGGKIINITSIDALHPSMVGLAHYDASKHGVWGFTKNSALELAEHNILVNAVAPGGINTPGVAALSQGASAEQMAAATQAFLDKIPLKRMGEPDEIGLAVLFLASDMSNYMTGSQIVVDGGALLS